MTYKYTQTTIPDWLIKEIDLAQCYYQTQSELSKKYSISEKSLYFLRKEGKIGKLKKRNRLRGFARCCKVSNNDILKSYRFESKDALLKKAIPSLTASISPKKLDSFYISVIFDEN